MSPMMSFKDVLDTQYDIEVCTPSELVLGYSERTQTIIDNNVKKLNRATNRTCRMRRNFG
jgi:hypothetical protein